MLFIAPKDHMRSSKTRPPVYSTKKRCAGDARVTVGHTREPRSSVLVAVDVGYSRSRCGGRGRCRDRFPFSSPLP